MCVCPNCGNFGSNYNFSAKSWYDVLEKLEEVQKSQFKRAAHRQSASADNGPTYVSDLEKYNDN